MRVHVRIHAELHVRHLALLARQFVDHLQFRDRLSVKAEDIIVQRKVYLRVRLTHAGKDDTGGRETSLDGGLHLIAAYAIGAKTLLSDDFQHLRIRIGLYRVMHNGMIRLRLLLHQVQRPVQHINIVIIEGSLNVPKFIDGEVPLNYVCHLK